MWSRTPSYFWAAFFVCGFLLTTAHAQFTLFRGYNGPGLSAEDNQLLFASIAKLNAAEPAQIGRSETWSNPTTKSSGTNTILRVFQSDGLLCHLLKHDILIAGQSPARDYRFTWCRTSTGEWKIKG